MVDLKKDKVPSNDVRNVRVVKKKFLIDPDTGLRIFPKNSDYFFITLDATSSN